MLVFLQRSEKKKLISCNLFSANRPCFCPLCECKLWPVPWLVGTDINLPVTPQHQQQYREAHPPLHVPLLSLTQRRLGGGKLLRNLLLQRRRIPRRVSGLEATGRMRQQCCRHKIIQGDTPLGQTEDQKPKQRGNVNSEYTWD